MLEPAPVMRSFRGSGCREQQREDRDHGSQWPYSAAGIAVAVLAYVI